MFLGTQLKDVPLTNFQAIEIGVIMHISSF